MWVEFCNRRIERNVKEAINSGRKISVKHVSAFCTAKTRGVLSQWHEQIPAEYQKTEYGVLLYHDAEVEIYLRCQQQHDHFVLKRGDKVSRSANMMLCICSPFWYTCN